MAKFLRRKGARI